MRMPLPMLYTLRATISVWSHNGIDSIEAIYFLADPACHFHVVNDRHQRSRLSLIQKRANERWKFGFNQQKYFTYISENFEFYSFFFLA